ncbi:MAG: von Willebrand factor type A domain-containing protein [Planctomycetota bacterium]
MKDNWKEEPQEDLKSKLTLYVMGEADAETTREVELALADDSVLRAQQEELVRALDLLRQPQLQPALSHDRRAVLRSAAAAGQAPSMPAGKVYAMPKWGVAAALLIFGGMITLWQQPWNLVKPESSQVASNRDAEAMGYLGYSAEEVMDESFALSALGYQSDDADDAWDYSQKDGSLSQALGNLTRDVPEGSSVGLVVAGISAPAIPPAEFEARNRWYKPEGRGAGRGTYLGPGDSIPPEFGKESNASAGVVFDDFENGDMRARTENILDSYSANILARSENLYVDVDQEQQLSCTLTDGYGRRFQNLDVLKYLHPQYEKESPADMFFRFYGDNAQTYTSQEALSTFAADVDTASYPMARQYLAHNQLPPKASIRTEEFLNYFDYALPAPKEDDFAVQIQATASKFGGQNQILLSIGIKARDVVAEARPSMNLVFVLDKSGSMAGTRMQLVKDALMLLVDQIRDTDTIGLVTFDSGGHVVLDSTPGTERYRIREAIRSLGTGGSTNAGEGLALGYQMMEKVYDPKFINRVVLASDGVANTGVTDQAQILRQVTARAEARVDLTTLGVGMGNHNDTFLEQLADHGNGSCHYLDDLQEAKRVLVDGFLGTMITVARDVKIQVEFDPKQVLHWRQLGYENRSLAHEDFRNDSVDAGEVGAGHEVVALYEVEPTRKADLESSFVTVRLRWKPEGSDKAVEREYRLNLAAGKGRWDLAPVRLREMAVVAQYAEVLRRSWHAQEDSYSVLRNEAKRLAGELAGEPEVMELVAMIDRTADLARWAPPTDDLSQLLEEARRQRLLEAQLVFGSTENDVEELLLQVRRQNQQLEDQLKEMLQRD